MPVEHGSEITDDEKMSYAPLLELSALVEGSDYTDVSSNKHKHLAEIYYERAFSARHGDE